MVASSVIRIAEPRLEEGRGRARLTADIVLPDRAMTLWFECEQAYARFLAPECCDAFLVAALIPAMRNGLDIIIDGEMSAKLYYNITSYYMSLVAELIEGTRPINIRTEGLTTRRWGGGGVLTGFSAGVDSFCTVLEHRLGRVPDGYVITHLLFNNVGSHGQSGDDADIFRLRLDRLKRVAETELDLPLIAVDSNLDELIGTNFQLTHTVRNTAVVLLFQKLAGKFLYSSAVHWRDAAIHRLKDIGYADAIALPLLSTETIDCISSGSQFSRFEKTRLIADVPVVDRHLDVCVNPSAAGRVNCSRCWKCLRTELTLEIVGALGQFQCAFDVDIYRKYRWLHLCDVLGSRDPLLAEIRTEIARSQVRVPILARLVAALAPNRLVHDALERWSFSDAESVPRATQHIRRHHPQAATGRAARS